MLRGEHVMARLQRGRLVPHRLQPGDRHVREASERLIGLYEQHAGARGTRARLEEEANLLEEELGPRLDTRRGFKIVRALAKLLEERARWAPPTETDPYTLRTRLFELAAALPELPAEGSLLEGNTREDVLSQVARETGVEDAAALMYADRQAAQVLSEFEAPTSEELVGRYNVAQVQGVLYGARGLTVDLRAGSDARLVFHYVKTLGLIYAVEATPKGHRLRLDGPLSIFGGTRKYGLRLAKLIPGLLLTEPWELHADVQWKGREASLELTSETPGLRSHYRGPATPSPEGEGDVRGAFEKAWARAKDTGGWELGEGPGILPLPPLRTALVPDFTLRQAGTEREVHLEILGFWSEKHLIDRVALVREAAKRGHKVLVAAPESLGSSPEALREATEGEVVPFKSRLDVKGVLAALGS